MPIPADFKLESDSDSFTQTPLGSRQLQRLCTAMAMHKFPRLASCPQSRREPKKSARNRASNRNPCRKGVRHRVACAPEPGIEQKALHEECPTPGGLDECPTPTGDPAPPSAPSKDAAAIGTSKTPSPCSSTSKSGVVAEWSYKDHCAEMWSNGTLLPSAKFSVKSPNLGDDSRILAEFPGCDGVFEVAGVWSWMTNKSRQTGEVTTPVVRKGGGKKPKSGIKSKDARGLL